MTLPAIDPRLAQLEALIAERTGLHFPAARWPDMTRGLRSAAADFGYTGDDERFIEWLLRTSLSTEQVISLAGHLTVGETYFFREKTTFEALEQQLLPPLLERGRRKGKRLRIWSAGCCTGEEPYSLAILLNKMVSDLADWQLTILATDINRRSLEKAGRGIYGEWSFRSTPTWVRRGYFRELGKGKYELHGETKRLVTFANLNLVEDVYPSLVNNTMGMDLVLCRNVLMYLHPDSVRTILKRFSESLVAEGVLVVSPSEASLVPARLFQTLPIPDAVFCRRPAGEPTHDASESLFERTGSVRRFPAPAEFPIELSPLPPTGPATSERDSAAVLPRNLKANQGRETPSTTAKTTSKRRVESPPEPPVSPQAEVRRLCEAGDFLAAAERLTVLFASAGKGAKPDNRDLALLLARGLANQGEFLQALEWCETAQRLDPLDQSVHYLTATILQAQERLEDAAAALGRALYIDPGFIVAYYVQGTILQRLNRIREGERQFRNALTLLTGRPSDELIVEGDGLTAGRLREVIRSQVENREG